MSHRRNGSWHISLHDVSKTIFFLQSGLRFAGNNGTKKTNTNNKAALISELVNGQSNYVCS